MAIKEHAQPEDLARLPLAPRASGPPMLGNSIAFLSDTTSMLYKLYQKHGPIFRIRTGWNSFTVLAGFEGRDFLVRGGAERYLTREAFFRPVREQLGEADFVLGVSGDAHKRLRRLLSIAYSRHVASPFVPHFIEAVRRYIRRFKPGDVFSVFKHARAMAFEQYCQAVAGESMTEYWRDVSRVVFVNMNVGGRVLPQAAYITPRYRRSRRRALGVMWDLVEDRRRHGPTPGKPATIIDTLIGLRDGEGKALDDDEVVCYAMYGFAGSSGYMARLISFLLYELLAHPEYLSRVQDEVQKAFAGGIQDALDVRAMRLLGAAYHESMRLHPVSQALPFVATEDFAFHGHRVRKGDQVAFSQIPMFFEDPPFVEPERFAPERCLAPRNEHRRMGAFNPFGMGKRTCTAQGLVELMAMTQVATLIQDLDLSLHPSDYRLATIVMPLPAPTRKFRLKVEARREMPKTVPAVVESKLIASFTGDDAPELQDILNNIGRRRCAPREIVIEQGDKPDCFYIIQQGSAEVLQRAGEGLPPRRVAVLDEGQYFGEIGLLYDRPRNATVRITENGPAELLVITGKNFETMVAEHDFIEQEIAALVRRRVVEESLTKVVPTLNPTQVDKLLPEFDTETIAAGEVIIRQGEPATRFYIVLEGQVTVSARHADLAEDRIVTTLGPGAFFGEIGLLLGMPRTATVTADGNEGDEILVGSVDADGFRKLLQVPGGISGDIALAMSKRILGLQKEGAWVSQ